MDIATLSCGLISGVYSNILRTIEKQKKKITVFFNYFKLQDSTISAKKSKQNIVLGEIMLLQRDTRQ